MQQEADKALKKAHDVCQEVLEIVGDRTGDVPEVSQKRTWLCWRTRGNRVSCWACAIISQMFARSLYTYCQLAQVILNKWLLWVCLSVAVVWSGDFLLKLIGFLGSVCRGCSNLLVEPFIECSVCSNLNLCLHVSPNDCEVVELLAIYTRGLPRVVFLTWCGSGWSPEWSWLHYFGEDCCK